MKYLFWFDALFSLFVVLFGFLLDCISFCILNILSIVFIISTVIIFGFWLIYSKNPISEIEFTFYLQLTTSIKSFYAYLIFSIGELIKKEIPVLSLLHIYYLIIFILLSIYINRKFSYVYKILKENTIENTKKIIKRSPQNSMWILATCFILIGLPVVLFTSNNGRSSIIASFFNLKLNLGFLLCVLTCAFVFMTLIRLPRFVVAKKYKVSYWF